jgi:pilus assembly protein CpaC
MTNYRDDRRRLGAQRARSKVAPTGTRRQWCLIATALIVAGYAAAAQEQQAGRALLQSIASVSATQAPVVLGANGNSIQATIRQEDISPEQISVPAGTSTVLDLNIPVARVEVSSPDVATITVLSPRQILVAGQKVGTTQVILWGDKDERLVLAVLVEPNVLQLRTAIQRAAPDARIDVRVVNEAVILSGSASSVDDAARIEDMARLVAPKVQNQIRVVGEQQVLLRCTVAEVSKSATRRLGVDGWIDVQSGVTAIPANDVANIDVTDIPPGFAFLSDNFTWQSRTDQGFGMTGSFGDLRFQLFIRAMQDNRLLKVLAEPNLVALSGQTAEFLAGGQFPVPVPQGTGAGNTITIEWKDFGVKLQFIPQVIGQQMIRLRVAPEVSELDFTAAVVIEGMVVPGVSQRRAATTVEIASGSTIAIAGLLSDTVRGSVEKIPALGDLPVLGPLFRSLEYQRHLTELIILVTPELVNSMQPDQVAHLPGESIGVPSDFELYMLGMLEGQPMSDDRPRDAALHTDIAPQYRKFTSPPEQTSVHGLWGTAEAVEAAP